MRLHTIFFSPTGTTRRIASAIAGGISGGQKTAESVDVTLSPAPEMTFGPDDMVILAAPVYGGRVAPLFKERLSKVTACGARCVVVAVYGNRAFEAAADELASFAGDLGFTVSAAAAFVGEHSYSTAGTPIAAGRPDAADLHAAGKFGSLIASAEASGELGVADVTALTDEPSPEQSMVNFRNFVAGYSKMQAESPRRFLPEVDTSLCDSCGVCVTVCPVGAIGADCRSLDADRCIKCCACVKRCPSGARSLYTPFAKPLSENFNARKEPRWVL